MNQIMKILFDIKLFPECVDSPGFLVVAGLTPDKPPFNILVSCYFSGQDAERKCSGHQRDTRF